MKKLFLTLAGLFTATILVGCATASYVTANKACSNPSLKFPDTVACVNANTENGRDAYSVSYRLYANQLLEQYNSGKISDIDAKIKLQDKFLELNKSHVNMINSLSGGSGGSTYCTSTGKSGMFCY